MVVRNSADIVPVTMGHVFQDSSDFVIAEDGRVIANLGCTGRLAVESLIVAAALTVHAVVHTGFEPRIEGRIIVSVSGGDGEIVERGVLDQRIEPEKELLSVVGESGQRLLLTSRCLS